MVKKLIQRTIIGGTALFLAILVPSVQVLGAAGEDPLRNTVDGFKEDEKESRTEAQESQSEDQAKEDTDQPEAGENEESVSGAESSGAKDEGDVEESDFPGASEGESESSLPGDDDNQTKEDSQSSQESKASESSAFESKASEAATESSAVKEVAGQAAKAFFEGEGTEESPYLIGTAKELEKLAELMASDYESYGNRSYRLTQNIQMKKGRNNHKAIGSAEQPFAGEFDGDGYVISRIKINRPKLDTQGLFGVIGEEGTVRNVGMTENSICGGENVGAIAGINYGTVESCFQTGEVYGINNNAGSIAGRNHGSVTDCYSTGLVCGGYRTGDYIPEAEGEEKGRNAGRGGFRDFIQTIAETIAETVAETVAYVIEETKAGIETLYEIVATTLSPEPGPEVQETEEKGPGKEETEITGTGITETEITQTKIEETELAETEMTEPAMESEQNETETTEPGEPVSLESKAEELSENVLQVYGHMEDGRVIAPKTSEIVLSGTHEAESKTAQENDTEDEPSEDKSTEENLTVDKTTGNDPTGQPEENDKRTEPEETEEPDEPEETEEETGADETDGELINDLPGTEDLGLTEEEQAALKVLGGIVGRNQGGSIENCFQAGRRAVKSTEWTSGGITGFNPGGRIENCCYAWPPTMDKPEREYEGVTAVSTELLTGEDAVGRLGLEEGIWSSRETEEDRQEDQGSDVVEAVRYRHYYPQPSVFADKGQPYQYTLGYFETDGLRVDTLTKRAYISTETAFIWLFQGTEYLDYEIKLEADLNLGSFGKSIGTMEQPFTGILDGDGHVITGLHQPLFGVLGDGSAVYYLLIDQSDVRQMSVRGEDEYGPESSVSGVLAGYSRNAVIDSCGAVGMIHLSAGSSSRPVYIGGLIGEAGAGTSIYESYAFVNIAEALGEGSRVTAGGLVGLMDQDAGAYNCYATGRLECSKTAGGFAGENRGEIRDSFVTTIIGTMAQRAGAFVGYMPEAGELPERKAESQDQEKESCTIISCAYDVQMSSCGDSYAQGMMTGEMSGEGAALPGGDWYTTDGAYPQLKCMALHTHETYILRSKASAIPLILPNGIYIADIPEGDQAKETEHEIRITGSVEMGLPTQIDGDEIRWSEADRVTLQEDGTAVLQMD